MKFFSTLVFLCGAFGYVAAQTPDTNAVRAITYFNEAKQVADRQQLWPVTLYGPMLMIEPRSRLVYANMPDSAGVLKRAGDIYEGVLPNDVIIANTTIVWGGTHWSTVLWPLPASRGDRLSEMTHEMFHRVQLQLGMIQHDPSVDYLSGYDGRLYLLLELQALKAAIDEPAAQRKTDLATALMLREKRHVLFPADFDNERRLEMNEGLAEFTGTMVGREPDSIKAYLDTILTHADERASLIRAMAYLTGPSYGYLLSQQAPGWTKSVDSSCAGFPALVKRYFGITAVPAPTDDAITAAIAHYHAEWLVDSEKSKEKQRKEREATYIDLFTKKPVLQIDLIKMHIGFNPSNMFALGDYGTVYPTAVVSDQWGKLTVTGAMLMKDWKIVYVAAGDHPAFGQPHIEGDGWTLDLAAGWKVVKVDELHYRLSKD